MSQTRLGSFIEAWINVLIGFSINWVMNMLILPLYGFQVTGGQAFSMGLIFTVVSVARSYAVRRWFNYYIVKAAQTLAHEARQPAKTQPGSYRHEGVHAQVERISLERNDK
jgi:hypothetical protein